MGGQGCDARIARQCWRRAGMHLAPTKNPIEKDSTQLFEILLEGRTKPRRRPMPREPSRGYLELIKVNPGYPITERCY